MLECTTSESKLRDIVNLAEGLDYNEWLASHSQYSFCSLRSDCFLFGIKFIATFIHLFVFRQRIAIAFFEHINLLYGTISEFCSMSGCPDMSGPCNRYELFYNFLFYSLSIYSIYFSPYQPVNIYGSMRKENV